MAGITDGSQQLSVVKHSHFLALSDEEFADRQAMAASVHRWFNATSEQRDQLAREASERRRVERETAGAAVPLTLDALLDKLGFSREYAEHLVQPYCWCDDSRDGWDRCGHARDLGL